MRVGMESDADGEEGEWLTEGGRREALKEGSSDKAEAQVNNAEGAN